MSKTANELTYASGIDPTKIKYKQVAILDQPDRTFEDLGELLYPVLVTTPRNEVVYSGYRSWEEDNKFMDFLSRKQVFYPHRAVNKQLGAAFENELKGSGMKIVHEYDSHHGRSHYWECRSDRFDKKIKDSFVVDDVVQVGMVVRNGIGSGIALGIDFETYRLSCLNGAISGSTSAGNIRFTHAGSYEHMRDRFLEAIPIAIERAKGLIDYYQQSVYINTNQKIAEDFYKRLRNNVSVGYFPANFNIDRDELKKEPKDQKISKIVNYKDDHSTLWETFNDFTKEIWHSTRLGFTGVRNSETALHRALLAQLPVSK